jgi:hypothetical protein
MSFKEYIKEIEKFIRETSKYPYFFSSLDLEIAKDWYSKKLPLDIIKRAIYEELRNIPTYKRGRFSLRQVVKHFEKENVYLSNYKKFNIYQDRNQASENLANRLDYRRIEKTEIDKEITEPSYTEIWKQVFDKYGLEFNKDLPEDKLRALVINHIWKNVLTKEEKKKLEREVLKEIKRDFNIGKIDIKKVAKRLIADKIKEKFNIP